MGCSSHVEEDTSRFSHAFSEDTRTVVLEVKLPLRDWLGSDYMPGQVLLESIAVPDFNIRRMQTLHMISFRRHLGNVYVAFRARTKIEEKMRKVEGGEEE